MIKKNLKNTVHQTSTIFDSIYDQVKQQLNLILKIKIPSTSRFGKISQTKNIMRISCYITTNYIITKKSNQNDPRSFLICQGQPDSPRTDPKK